LSIYVPTGEVSATKIEVQVFAGEVPVCRRAPVLDVFHCLFNNLLSASGEEKHLADGAVRIEKVDRGG